MLHETGYREQMAASLHPLSIHSLSMIEPLAEHWQERHPKEVKVRQSEQHENDEKAKFID